MSGGEWANFPGKPGLGCAQGRCLHCLFLPKARRNAHSQRPRRGVGAGALGVAKGQDPLPHAELSALANRRRQSRRSWQEVGDKAADPTSVIMARN